MNEGRRSFSQRGPDLVAVSQELDPSDVGPDQGNGKELISGITVAETEYDVAPVDYINGSNAGLHPRDAHPRY